MIKLLEIDQPAGMNTIISKQDLPDVLLQKIYNLEISKKIGSFVKRKGFKNVITSGLTSLSNMMEFTDKNGGRQILLRDTTLKECVYTGGVYQAISAIANDKRNILSTISAYWPVLLGNDIRSGGGITNATDDAIWFGYIDAVSRFPNSGTPIAVAAGKYYDNQFIENRLSEFIYALVANQGASKVASTGAAAGSYWIYLVPVLDGEHKGIPRIMTKTRLDSEMNISASRIDVAAQGYITTYISVLPADADEMKRITAFDIFVTDDVKGLGSDLEIFPAYFLERVPLDGDGRYIFEIEGTLEAADPPTYIRFAAFANWETFHLQDYFISFTYDSVDYTYQLGLRDVVTPPAGSVDYPLVETSVNALNGVTVTCRVFPRWFIETTPVNHYTYPILFDNYYRQKGGEMYAYLGLPLGEPGLNNPQYKYGAVVNNRYVIFGMSDPKKGYYSAEGSPDALCSLNDLTFKKEPTGGITVGHDLIVFSKEWGERITIFGNQNANHDYDFMHRGITNQRAVGKVDDNLIFGFDYAGPWMLRDRVLDEEVGIALDSWWKDDLTESHKDNCVVGYDHLNRRILFSFPTYTTSPFTAGIIFVFDLRAYLRGRSNGITLLPWWIMKSTHAMKCWTQSEDSHFLTGSATAIVDWNQSTQDENVDTLLQLKQLRNPIAGNKENWYDRLYLTKEFNASETLTLTLTTEDGDVDITDDLNDDDNAIIRRVLEEMELKIETASNQYDAEIMKIQVTGMPRML